MKALIQRVATAKVTGRADISGSTTEALPRSATAFTHCIAFCIVVGAELVSEIGVGLCVLLGISKDDTQREAEWL